MGARNTLWIGSVITVLKGQLPSPFFGIADCVQLVLSNDRLIYQILKIHISLFSPDINIYTILSYSYLCVDKDPI